MKRRLFLGALGAAVAAPAVPFAAPSAPAVVYSRSSYGLAVLHARTRPHVSAKGIAYCLKLPVEQAKAMMTEMAQNGLITPLRGAAGGSMRATSNILINDPWGLARTSAPYPKSAAASDDTTKAKQSTETAEPKLDDMIAYLRDLCVQQGVGLHARCVA